MNEIISAAEFKTIKKRSKPRNLESKMQQVCVRWFRSQYPKYERCLYAIPNGSHRNARTGAILKREGVLKGQWDLGMTIARNGYHGLFIECKIHPNKLTPEQAEQMGVLLSQGYSCKVVYSVEEFINVVQNYLK